MGFSASCSGFTKAPLYFHRVQEGQSLGDIAANYGVDASALQANRDHGTDLIPQATESRRDSPVMV